MSHYDPNRMDPNRPDLRDARAERAFFSWNWIIGGLAALVVLFVALSFFGGGDDRTAQTPPAPRSTCCTTPTPRKSRTVGLTPRQ